MRFKSSFLQYAGIASMIACAALVTTVVLSHRADAAAARYKFTVKGIVTEINVPGNTIRVNVKDASERARGDLLDKETDFNVRGAKYYRWVNGKKNRVSFTKMAQVGDQVVVYGTAKDNDQYNAAWVVRNDRSFTIIGKLRDYREDEKRLRVEVISSTYKANLYKGKDVWVEYDDNSKLFNNANSDMAWDALTASDQRVKVQGEIEGNKWDIAKMWDNYKKAK